MVFIGFRELGGRERKITVEQARVCAQVETFTRIVQVGVIPSPNPTPEEVAAVDRVNAMMRQLLEAALSGGGCG